MTHYFLRKTTKLTQDTYAHDKGYIECPKNVNNSFSTKVEVMVFCLCTARSVHKCFPLFSNVPIGFHHFNVFILGLKKVKEERQDLNEVEEKYQDQKDHDVNGEKSVSCSIQVTEVKRPFSCSQCGNTFKWKVSLMNHVRSHSGEKPFSCCQCGNTFRCKENLTNHMLIHAGIKPFTCSQCGKSFTKKRQLKDHLVTHTSEKPFSCSQCGKSFTRKANLKNHMLIHAGIKPFTCSQCGKSFTQKGDLKNHLVTHSSEKPFSCSQCGNTFTRKANLKKHMLIRGVHK